MTLLEVRTQFAKESGRYDLVLSATTFDNNGADYYINRGQEMLDRMLEFPKDEGEFTFSLATGAISTTLTNVRVVRGVVVVDSSDETIRQLTRSSLREMRDNYGDEKSSLSSVTRAEPTEWGLGWLRTTTTANTTALTTEGNTKQLITMPPADRTYTVRVQGLFGSPALSANTDLSFWTIQHPDILIQAALYKLEVAYRNYEGARATLNAIEEAVSDIDNEIVEQAIVENDVLQDSHRFIKKPAKGAERYLN